MAATVNTTMLNDVQVTSEIAPETYEGTSGTNPCIINVELSPPPAIEVGVKQSITAEEVITAFNSSASSIGFAGPLTTVTLFSTTNTFTVPSDIYGDIVLNMVMAHLDVGEEVGAITELLIDITYDKTTFALLLPQEDLDYLQSIGTISSVTLSYVQKVSK